MALSAYSILAALLWTALFIFLFSTFRRITPLVKHSGPLPLLILAAVCGLRLLFPVDLPGFTRIVSFQGDFSEIAGLFTGFWGNTPFSFARLVAVVWIAGAVYFLVEKVKEYRSFSQKISNLLPDEDGESVQAAKEVAALLHVQTPQIVRSSRFTVPQIAGLFRPVILTPNYPYTKEEYLLIFRHEMQHWKSRDLWIKLCSEIVCCLFWWNPSCKLWQAELSQSLEMRCDRAVLNSMGKEAAAAYLNVLNQTYLYSVDRPARLSWNYAVANLCASEEMLLQREKVMIGKPSARKQAVYSGLTLICAAALFVFSYAFQIQPYHAADYGALDGETHVFITPMLDLALSGKKDVTFVPITQENFSYLMCGGGRYSINADMRSLSNVTREQAIRYMQGGIPLLGDRMGIDPNEFYPKEELSEGVTLWPVSYRELNGGGGCIIETKFRYCFADGAQQYRHWNATYGRWVEKGWTDF